ncbi:MAG: hypothetical protein WCJ62_02675 [Flavobacterium sp.]
MKNKIWIIFYALCIVGLLIEIFDAGYNNVHIYQILLILCSSWLLFNKIKEFTKDNKNKNKTDSIL